ncbi:MAG: hypothetical protein ACPHL6_09895, partial [Rubripirellula sp.]
MVVFWFLGRMGRGNPEIQRANPGVEVHRKNGQIMWGVARRKSLDVDSVTASRPLQVDGKYD